MPTKLTTTTNLIIQSAAIPVLQNTEPLLTRIVKITQQGNDFIIWGEDVKTSTYVIKGPKILVTKNEVATFLNSLSGISVSGANIVDLQLDAAQTYILVVMV